MIGVKSESPISSANTAFLSYVNPLLIETSNGAVYKEDESYWRDLPKLLGLMAFSSKDLRWLLYLQRLSWELEVTSFREMKRGAHPPN